jgi:hypothetical protein
MKGVVSTRNRSIVYVLVLLVLGTSDLDILKNKNYIYDY